MKLTRVAKTFSMEPEKVKELEKEAERDFNGNQSLMFNTIYDFWRENKRKKQRQFFREIDTLVAKAIAEAKGEKKPSPKQLLTSLEDLRVYGASKTGGRTISDEEAVQAINEIRNERQDAFASRH